MKSLLLATSLLCCTQLFPQYYYNDILTNRQSNQQYLLLKSNQVKKIQVSSYDAGNQPAQGFALEQTFSSDYTQLVTTSATATGATSQLLTRYENDRVARTVETAGNVETKVTYAYDEKGNVLGITSVTADSSAQLTSVEKHLWQYTNGKQPLLMLKIKNGSDTTRVEMIPDEKGNIGEEHWKRKGADIETYYYYYNDNNQLTDIVRFNKRAQKLLPDFTFEYDEHGRVKQLLQVSSGSSNYMVWQIVYNAQGLKQQEICHDRQKQLVGRMEYLYQ